MTSFTCKQIAEDNISKFILWILNLGVNVRRENTVKKLSSIKKRLLNLFMQPRHFVLTQILQ
jgi:hypothetical protein